MAQNFDRMCVVYSITYSQIIIAIGKEGRGGVTNPFERWGGGISNTSLGTVLVIVVIPQYCTHYKLNNFKRDKCADREYDKKKSVGGTRV